MYNAIVIKIVTEKKAVRGIELCNIYITQADNTENPSVRLNTAAQ